MSDDSVRLRTRRPREPGRPGPLTIRWSPPPCTPSGFSFRDLKGGGAVVPTSKKLTRLSCCSWEGRSTAGLNDNIDPKQPVALDTASVEGYVADALVAIVAASSTAELKQVRFDHVDGRSPPALADQGIGALPPVGHKEAGTRADRARGQVNQAVVARQEELAAGELAQALVAERIDMTLPVEPTPRGGLHPITTLTDNMCDAFLAMGWEAAEGPGLEAEWYNFNALNLGVDHPARGEQDTLWVEPTTAGTVSFTHL